MPHVPLAARGSGEYFIRSVTAYDVSMRMELGGKSLEQAANHTVHKVLPAVNGDGGLIAIDREGNIATPFNTEGMYRAWQTIVGNREMLIYGDE